MTERSVAPAHLAWAKGGTASFVTAADDAVTLSSTVPAPPGSRLEGTLTTGDAVAVAVAVKIKIHSSKREEDGTFTLKGRLLEATRALRETVAKRTKRTQQAP